MEHHEKQRVNERKTLPIKLLENTSYHIEEGAYQINLSEEEVERLKDQIAIKSVEKHRIEQEIKAYTDPLKEQLKEIKKGLDNDTKTLHAGRETVHGKIYHKQNFETQEMEFYDGDGQMIDSRPLMSHERQRILGG